MIKAASILLLPLLFLVIFPYRVANAAESTKSAVVLPTAANDYTLPYPGILPDNPLYQLKVFRDMIIGFFISDPLRKSTFDLLQSDKRLQASRYLLKKGVKEASLSRSTLSKSTNYMQESLDEAKRAKATGENVTIIVSKLKNAIGKHILVITDMSKTKGVLAGYFDGELNRLTDLEKVVSEFGKQQ